MISMLRPNIPEEQAALIRVIIEEVKNPWMLSHFLVAYYLFC